MEDTYLFAGWGMSNLVADYFIIVFFSFEMLCTIYFFLSNWWFQVVLISLSLSLSLSLPHISNFNKIYKFLKKWSVCLAKIIFVNLFYYLVYFYYYLWQECYCYSTIIVLQVKVRGILISMTFARRGSHNSRWNAWGMLYHVQKVDLSWTTIITL